MTVQGVPPRAVGFHDLQCLMGVGIAGRMCHGYLQRIRDLVLPEFIRRVETVAFEHRLYRDKPDWIVAGACLRHFH